MMSFCKKSVHSFLDFTNFMANGTVLESPTHLRNIPSPAGGLIYITVFNDIRRPINVVESAGVKPPPSSPTTTTTERDSGRIVFLDDIRGSSCTESLGFESFDERVVDDEIENVNNGELGLKPSCNIKSRCKRSEKVSKNFPPPLPSLDRNGRPKFVLRPVRKDGRLELKVVNMERPEIFRASRQDGRLRLQVIDEDREVEDHQTEYETTSKDEEEVVEEKARGERLFQTTNCGFSRCNVAVSHHHHHNQPIVCRCGN